MSRHGSKRLVTVKNAAELTGKSQDTIRRRIRDGSLPGAFRDGHDQNAPWLIPEDELQLAGLNILERPADGACSAVGVDPAQHEALRSAQIELAVKNERIRVLEEQLAWLREQFERATAPPPLWPTPAANERSAA